MRDKRRLMVILDEWFLKIASSLDLTSCLVLEGKD
jgi:hypothetical protein